MYEIVVHLPAEQVKYASRRKKSYISITVSKKNKKQNQVQAHIPVSWLLCSSHSSCEVGYFPLVLVWISLSGF